MKMILMVALGGAIGSSFRYLVGVTATRLFGMGFPWGTLIVNIVGSFLMGALIVLLALRFSVSNEIRAFLAIGVLGGFTTFSSFALDIVSLYEKKQYLASMGYMSVSVICSILGMFLGMAVVRSFLG
ncbi:MAG: fluoride efflux transporter CrcB [bacterium]|nr:fluoride efflux transporter CrcB [bacterium]